MIEEEDRKRAEQQQQQEEKCIHDKKLNPERLKKMLKNKRTGHTQRSHHSHHGGTDTVDNAMAFTHPSHEHEIHFGQWSRLDHKGHSQPNVKTEGGSGSTPQSPGVPLGAIIVESPSDESMPEEEEKESLASPTHSQQQPPSQPNQGPPVAGVFEYPAPWGGQEDQGDGGPVRLLQGHPPSTAIEGILTILYGAMLNMPDTSITTVMTSVIFPEYILILINHPSDGVRYAATRLLLKYVQRTRRHYPNGYRLDKIAGYYILASQLQFWPWKGSAYTEGIVLAILSLIHDTEVTTFSNLPELPSKGARIRSPALPPLLSLLPSVTSAGLKHVSISHALIVHLHDLLAKVPGLLIKEYESLGIFESLCKTLEALVTSKKAKWTTDIGQDGREILFDDLHYLLRFIGNITIFLWAF